MDESISDEEAFEHYLHNFLEWLAVLQLNPVELCSAWGNYNVAWELVSDLNKDGNSIVTMPCSYLSDQQKQSIASFLTSLREVPQSILVTATSAAKNVESMSHPCWLRYREAASALLSALASEAKRNREYFHE